MYRIYVWYVLMILSLVSDIILNIRYEKYKKDHGYVNKYKGSYVFKPLREGKIIKFLANTLAKYIVIGFCFMPMIELALFKGEAKKRLHEEEKEGSVAYQNPNIIDVDSKFIGEEQIDMEEYEKVKTYSEQREREIRREEGRQTQERLDNLFREMMGIFPDEFAKEEVIIDEEGKENASNDEDNSRELHLKLPIKTSNDK